MLASKHLDKPSAYKPLRGSWSMRINARAGALLLHDTYVRTYIHTYVRMHGAFWSVDIDIYI